MALEFDYRNIDWKVYLVILIIELGIIYWISIENKSSNYYLLLLLPLAFLYLIGRSNIGEYIQYRNKKEAIEIAERFLKQEMGIKRSEYTVPEGYIKKDGSRFHIEETPPFWELGFTIIDKDKYPYYCSITVHGLREDLEEMDFFTDLEKPYRGQRMRKVFVPVDKSEPEKYKKTMKIIKEHNEAEGFEEF